MVLVWSTSTRNKYNKKIKTTNSSQSPLRPFFLSPVRWWSTLPKTNMAPENGPEKRFVLEHLHFQKYARQSGSFSQVGEKY